MTPPLECCPAPAPTPRAAPRPPLPRCRSASLEGGSAVGPDGRPRPSFALLATKIAVAVGVVVMTRRVALARVVMV